MDEQLWDAQRLAEFLNTSAGNVYYLISQGRIPGVVRLGPRMIRVVPETVKDWIAAGGFAGVAR